MQLRKRAKPIQFGKSKAEKQVPEAITVSESTTTVEVTTSPDFKKDAVILENAEPEKIDESQEEKQNDTNSETDQKQEEKEPEESKEDTSQETFSFTTDEPIPSQNKKKHSFLLFFVVAFFAFLLGLGGIIAYTELTGTQKLSFSFFNQPTPTPTVAPTEAPTAEPVDLSMYTIRVLNGSGITGEAATVKKQLEAIGFSVGDVGNADEDTYTKTVISANNNVDQTYLKTLIEAVKKNYLVDETVKTIPPAGGADVVITIGSEKAK